MSWPSPGLSTRGGGSEGGSEVVVSVALRSVHQDDGLFDVAIAVDQGISAVNEHSILNLNVFRAALV